MKVSFKALGLVFLSTLVILAMTACGSSDGDSVPPSTHTVSGTLTLPDPADSKSYIVAVVTDMDSDPAYYTEGTISGTGTTINYSISEVPTGCPRQ
jgi:hypothetical protein